MAKLIAIMGESGAGKTTAMRTLPCAQTCYIDADLKGLSWRGWKLQYNKQSKNYMAENDPLKVLRALWVINNDRPDIHYVVIDTINGIMVADEMRRMAEKGYDKWQDLAASVWTIIDDALKMRDDLTVIFLAHSQTDRDDNGYAFTRIKTSGKKLDKIVLESKFTTVLLCKCVDGRHVFETHADHSTAKTPLGAFEPGEKEVDNDIMEIIKRLEEF
jgi:hypothetical protein